MARRRWRRIVLIGGVSALGLVLLVPWMVMQGFEEVLSNDDVARLETELSLLNGRVHLGLYRQHMWDAVLWYVTAHGGSPPSEMPAHNAIVDSTQQVIARDAQLGFDRPAYTLIRVSQTSARLCEGAQTCRTIHCDSASVSCRLDSN